MARKEQVTCDVCGAQKQETNHWFVAVMEKTPIPDDIFLLSLHRTNNVVCEPHEVKVDLCGEACVLKKVSELISKQ
jgi:hypothetical protein